MGTIIALGVLIGLLALGWIALKLFFAYIIACLIYLGLCSVKDKIDDKMRGWGG